MSLPARAWQLVALLFSIAVMAAPHALRAQDAPPVLKWDFDVGFGRTSGGGVRDVPMAFAFGALIATPVRARSQGDVIIALGLRSHWPMDYGTSCRVILGTPGCIPAYPKFRVYSALVGQEFGNRRGVGGTRLLVGPAVFRTDEKEVLAGLQARADVSIVQVSRAGLTFWTQLSSASPFQSDRFVLWTFGIGARLR
jgi:hypothetical protein